MTDQEWWENRVKPFQPDKELRWEQLSWWYRTVILPLRRSAYEDLVKDK